MFETGHGEEYSVNGVSYEIKKLLGKGKGGYSYLAVNDGREYVLKQIHHEPCAYYQFADKIQSEINDYKRLSSIGIRMPKMIDVDIDKERIVKEYIDGETIYELVARDQMDPDYIRQVKAMCELLYPAKTNIDYFPTNFVVHDGELFYIDYECNDYMEEWDFENWGIKYWSKTPEFLEYYKELNLYLTKLGKKARAEHRKKHETMGEKFSEIMDGISEEMQDDMLKVLKSFEEELDKLQ